MARVALVTGGTRGIGHAISAHLAKAGCKVAANYAGNDEAAQKTAAELGIHVFKWDVGDEAACAEGIAKVEAALGPVDILVNNAGITKDGFFHKMTAQQWRDVIRVDLDSLFYMTRPVIEGMRARGFGRIINISGKSEPEFMIAATPTKAAIHAWSKGLSREVGPHGVTVNCIPPGRIMSEQIRRKYSPEYRAEQSRNDIPVGRYGEPHELAALAVFLASPVASYITGTVMPVDGGLRKYAF
jgi:acetoacetyl-CoA reductase